MTTNNPGVQIIQKTSVSDPSILVIFGITGDLAQRKLLPALYHLIRDDVLSENTEIVGVTRREMSVEDLMSGVKKILCAETTSYDPTIASRLQAKLSIFKMDLTNDADYAALHTRLDDIESQKGARMNRYYYLSLPPAVHGNVVEHLGRNGLHEHNIAKTRLLVEKPFGYDEESARDLIEETSRYFNEEQIFRIDHYLAKETVQNILMFRFNNPIFEGAWNNKHVRSIEIAASESIGIEGRAEFYEQVGALRDLIQSHLLQLLAVVTMERPHGKMTDSNIQAARLDLLRAIKPFDPRTKNSHAVRGQYQGYTEEVDNSHSYTETFAGVRLSIDNNRWRGVPITLYTGKGLAEKRTEIRIAFAHPNYHDKVNVLTFSIQPAEGVSIALEVKKPNLDTVSYPVTMDFSYARSFGNARHPDGYEHVLADALRGDRTLFTTSEEVMTTWRIIQPLLNEWAKDGEDMQVYAFGTNGPTIP